MAYSDHDKTIRWNESKNEWLKQTRGITFEEIVIRLSSDELLDIIDHPDLNRYPGQKVFVVQVGDRVVLVPFVEDEETVFLKTIIPSRKMKKKYIKGICREA
jgi:hypothetical protein